MSGLCVSRWSEVTRRLDLWVQVLELNDAGEFTPVEVLPPKDVRTGGIFQLRQVAVFLCIFLYSCEDFLLCVCVCSRFIFNALADGRRFSLKISLYMAPFILSFTRISCPGPFAEKQPQSMMFPPPCFTVANFRLAWTCTGLSRGTRLVLQDLSPWRRSVLLMVGFVTLVPALCRSFTRSPRMVLGFLLIVLGIILTPRGEILRGAPD
ncbi:unnamed protein product [Oncorhynchus mykiss]|uniref:Uncharacterized protein n=1 Tax=Oncorhynchus mykiss TaxID=8022 RepID=A0A061AEB9_ONCMY|nr:unnamed protein product [Oncorhynchus mykiss]